MRDLQSRIWSANTSDHMWTYKIDSRWLVVQLMKERKEKMKEERSWAAKFNNELDPKCFS